MGDAGTDTTVLRRVAQHLRTGFDEAAVGMAVTALDGRYLRVNPAFCALVGRDEQQLLSMSRQDLTHPDDTSEADARTDAAVERGAQTVLVDKRYLHAHGREIPGRVATRIMRDAGGEPTYLFTQVLDVSELDGARCGRGRAAAGRNRHPGDGPVDCRDRDGTAADLRPHRRPRRAPGPSPRHRRAGAPIIVSAR